MKLANAAALLAAGNEETLYHYTFPREHWRCLRTNNSLERLLREVRLAPICASKITGSLPSDCPLQLGDVKLLV
jgi:putative transposase